MNCAYGRIRLVRNSIRGGGGTPTRNHDAIASIHDGSAVNSSIYNDTKCQIILTPELIMKENFLVDLSKQFAVDIVNLCTDIKENRKSNVLLNQVCGAERA